MSSAVGVSMTTSQKYPRSSSAYSQNADAAAQATSAQASSVTRVISTMSAAPASVPAARWTARTRVACSPGCMTARTVSGTQ